MNNKEEKTVKSYLQDILNAIKYQSRLETFEKEQENFNINYLFGVFAFFSLVLISNGSQDNPDFSWLQNNKFALKLWGISLATIYLGISIERLTFFKPLWEFTLTKVAISVAISLLIVFSTGKAAGVINSVFGVDASSFPFTLTFTAAMITFNYLAPLIFFLALVGGGHLLIVISWCKSRFYDKDKPIDLPPMNSVFFAILSGFVVYHGWQWSTKNFSYDAIPQKAYLLAHKLDFNAKHECANLKSGIPVVFLGNTQNTVLADLASQDIPSLEWFFESNIKVPEQFYRVKCDIKNYSEN